MERNRGRTGRVSELNYGAELAEIQRLRRLYRKPMIWILESGL